MQKHLKGVITCSSTSPTTPQRDTILNPRAIQDNTVNDKETETNYTPLSDSDSEVVVSCKPQSKQKRVADSESDDVDSIHAKNYPDLGVKGDDVPVKKRKIVKTEDDSMPLPDPFPLPKHYPQDIESALQRKMSSKEKQRFISEVASAMLRFKRYPSHEDYLCVARTVMEKYPFLKSSGAKPYVSVMHV